MNEWYCPNCDTKNSGSVKTCTSCGCSKPADAVEATNISADYTPKKWKCNVCGYENPAKAKKCLECGEVRGSQKERKKINPAFIVIPVAVLCFIVIPMVKGIYGTSAPEVTVTEETYEEQSTTQTVTTAEIVPTLSSLHLSSMYPNIYYQIYTDLASSSLTKEYIAEKIAPYSDRYDISEEYGAYKITDRADTGEKIELYFVYSEKADADILASMNYHHINNLYVMYVQDDRRNGDGISYSVINSVAGKFTYDNYKDCEYGMLHTDFDKVPHDIAE